MKPFSILALCVALFCPLQATCMESLVRGMGAVYKNSVAVGRAIKHLATTDNPTAVADDPIYPIVDKIITYKRGRFFNWYIGCYIGVEKDADNKLVALTIIPTRLTNYKRLFNLKEDSAFQCITSDINVDYNLEGVTSKRLLDNIMLFH